ncbi:sigma-70 family RNA polymerase sigma factor [Pendulispora albinea]|uniref:Sigma-70 family RNA polymerase sigma factor n=1 Tax=Pendulispora albinea TaxID=2741071 RepID=A0ABZ2MAZ8_9BACT
MSPESRRSHSTHKLSAFESCRRELLAFAYRMLGDVARAEDMVQETWLRWQKYDGEPESDKAFLVTIVTRLCLNELDSAKMRREESRADRRPEPVDLEEGGMPLLEQDEQIEQIERISMAFLVVLQRLTPAERAVLLLHDVFEFDHGEIGTLVAKAPPRAASCSSARD